MRKIILTLVLFLLVAGIGSPKAEAGVASDVSEVLGKVRDIFNRVRTIYARTGGLPGMANTLASSRAELNSGTPLRDLIEVARDEVTELAQAEAQRLVAFVNSSEPARVRTILVDFVTDLRDVANAQLDLMACMDLPCVPTEMPEITLERLLDAIENAPASALYPIYRAEDLLARFGNLGPILRCLRDELVDNRGTICDVLTNALTPRELVNSPEKLTALGKVRKLLTVSAWLAKNLGTAMQSVSKSFDIEFEAALWGWVGVSIDSDVVDAAGKRLAGAAPSLQWIADWLDKQIKHYELVSYQQTVIENQQLILDRLSAQGLGAGRGAGRGFGRRR